MKSVVRMSKGRVTMFIHADEYAVLSSEVDAINALGYRVREPMGICLDGPPWQCYRFELWNYSGSCQDIQDRLAAAFQGAK